LLRLPAVGDNAAMEKPFQSWKSTAIRALPLAAVLVCLFATWPSFMAFFFLFKFIVVVALFFLFLARLT
jgi:hypothetical protein